VSSSPPAQTAETDQVDPSARILQAAVDCYTEYGVPRATMAEVGRLAGVSRATVYRYFPGPRALQDATMDLMASDVQRQVVAAATPEQSLEEFIATYFEVLAAHLVALRGHRQQLDERETIPWAMYHSSEEPTRRFVARLLRARLPLARSRGEIDPDLTDTEVTEAVWIAVRAITSIRSSPVVDLDDPTAVGAWFARQVTRGLSVRD
jgi:AcrR family transcriptional regulator